MGRTSATSLLLVALALVYPASTKQRTGRPLLSSVPEDCRSRELHVTSDQPAWVVSPGYAVSGVTDGSQQICKWTVKAPPGYGVVIEVADLRLRRSRRCAASRVLVQAGLSAQQSRIRPLVRFCGRGPKNPLWKTTFSEVNIEYKSNGATRKKSEVKSKSASKSRSQKLVTYEDRPSANSAARGRPSSPSSSSSSHLTRAEKIARIKALQRLYNLRSSDRKASPSAGYQPASQRRRQYYSYQQNTNSRRFYRHSNGTGDGGAYDPTNDTIVIDGDDFVYDADSHAFGAITGTSAEAPSVRLFSVGEPTWISSDFILHDGMNVTEAEVDEEAGMVASPRKANKRKNKKNKKKRKKQGKKQRAKEDPLEDEDGSLERIPRSAWAPSSGSYRGSSRRSYHRTRYYTVSRGRPSRRKQYRVTISRHDPPARTSSPAKPQRDPATSSSPSRGHNEIIPRKPSKHVPESSKEVYYPSKTFGFLDPKPAKPEAEEAPATPSSGHDRRELFVLKVRSFKSHCGGEITDDRGRFTSPGYPQKTGGKNSCFWRFKTPPGSHWKLQCTHFRIRKSRNCMRDHLAIRINEGDWTRYCGREGPSVALTSSHAAYVDVVLNTFRNDSARTICSWESRYLGGAQNHYGYRRYWSYNLTRITTPPPTTTTTTTTTTTLPPSLAYQQTWSCTDYRKLTSDHTMCRSTPPTCSVYLEGVTRSERAFILDSHNKYRAIVARGEENEGLPGPQYSASDMQQLVWNDELAQVAQAWASACPDYHDCQDCRRVLSRDYYVGQNIFYEWSSSNGGSVWETAVRLWYEEVKYVPNYLTKSFRMMDHAVIGHYTQLVWAETREVGCGATYHDCSKVFKGRMWKLKCKIYVCNYGPTGNYVRKPMYSIGPPASACPPDTRPSIQYPGLCALR